MQYIDKEFKLHTENQHGEYSPIAKEIFPGKCKTFIEGYRYIPFGESWTRSDGVVFTGEMITPWKPYDELDTAQREYERQLLAEYTEYLKILGVEV